MLKMYKEFVVLCIIFISSGCVPTSGRLTSETGKRACLRQVAMAMPLNNQQEKQVAYRDCLRSIDKKLTQAALVEKARQEKAESEKILAEQLEQASWASQEERWLHCKSNQHVIIELDRRHTRAYSKLLGGSNRPNQPTTEKADLERELNSIRVEIAMAIPERMRAGQPLIPDSLLIFKHCNSDDFTSLGQK